MYLERISIHVVCGPLLGAALHLCSFFPDVSIFLLFSASGKTWNSNSILKKLLFLLWLLHYTLKKAEYSRFQFKPLTWYTNISQ